MSRKPARQKVVYVLDTFSGHDLDGTLGDAAEFITRMCNVHGPDARVNFDNHDRFDDSYSFRVETMRDETDAEYETRVMADTAARQAQLTHEHKVLNHLAKKLNVKIISKD